MPSQGFRSASRRNLALIRALIVVRSLRRIMIVWALNLRARSDELVAILKVERLPINFDAFGINEPVKGAGEEQ
jgi:hypothetical protein